jgi:hypothetical protein
MVCFSFLGFGWTLIDRCYIKDVRSQLQVQEWRKFLSSFGVLDFLAVKQQDVTFTRSELVTIHKRVFCHYNRVVFQIRLMIAVLASESIIVQGLWDLALSKSAQQSIKKHFSTLSVSSVYVLFAVLSLSK